MPSNPSFQVDSGPLEVQSPRPEQGVEEFDGNLDQEDSPATLPEETPQMGDDGVASSVEVPLSDQDDLIMSPTSSDVTNASQTTFETIPGTRLRRRVAVPIKARIGMVRSRPPGEQSPERDEEDPMLRDREPARLEAPGAGAVVPYPPWV